MPPSSLLPLVTETDLSLLTIMLLYIVVSNNGAQSVTRVGVPHNNMFRTVRREYNNGVMLRDLRSRSDELGIGYQGIQSAV